MTNIMKRNNNGNAGTNATRTMTPFGGWVDGVLQNSLSRFFENDLWDFDDSLSKRRLPVNLRETEKSYELELVAPGLKKEDFSVNLNNDLLTISFEHKEENKEENKQEGYLRREYYMQSFSRSFTLDDTIDAEQINAQYRDGILHVRLPKKESAQKLSKTIQIQ
jgi:HSP20 family protein